MYHTHTPFVIKQIKIQFHVIHRHTVVQPVLCKTAKCTPQLRLGKNLLVQALIIVNILFMQVDLNVATRTRRDCPMEGCTSRNLKSISDHLKCVHKIFDRAERLILCQKAKEIYVSQNYYVDLN